MQTICFVNQKGGVGKTTSCLNIGAALQKAGKRVLLIDMDAQGSLTKSAGIMQLAQDAPSVSEMLSGEKTAAEVLIRRDGCPDLLPSDIRLSGAEVSLIGAAGRDFILKEALAPLQKDYDFALIDCSPSLSILTLMALTASDGIIIPVAAQYMPLDGIMQLMQTVDVVRRRMNPDLKITSRFMMRAAVWTRPFMMRFRRSSRRNCSPRSCGIIPRSPRRRHSEKRFSITRPARPAQRHTQPSPPRSSSAAGSGNKVSPTD